VIRVQRDTTEPAALTRTRDSRLAIAMLAYDEHGAPSAPLADALTGYDAADLKKALYRAQHKKCAWCERRRDFSSSPIDHYRPKNGAWRNEPGEPRSASHRHYWWLTWTWENLLFSCARCNDAGHKANYFPLLAGTDELPPPPRPFPSPVPPALFDVSVEQPLLIDPALGNFLDHVRWAPSSTHLARQLWSPTHRTEQGRMTIKILKLEELIDEVTKHLIDNVLQGITDVEQHMRGRRFRQAAARWQSVLAFLEPERDFTAATWCALTHWMDDTRLSAWKLAPLLQPG
jgi:hypothetical protein